MGVFQFCKPILFHFLKIFQTNFTSTKNTLIVWADFFKGQFYNGNILWYNFIQIPLLITFFIENNVCFICL